MIRRVSPYMLMFFLFFQVIEKFYSLQKEILTRFGAKLQDICGTLHISLQQARTLLERAAFDFITTVDIVTSITLLQVS